MPKRIEGNHLRLRGQLVLVLNSGIDFIAMHFDCVRRFDAETDLPTLRAQDDDSYVGTDRDAFAASS